MVKNNEKQVLSYLAFILVFLFPIGENNEKSTNKSLEEIIKAEIEESKQRHKTAKRYEKHIRVLPFIDELKVFWINKIFRLMEANRKGIDKRTLSDYLDTLHTEGYLELEIYPGKFGHPYHLYYLKDIDPEMLERIKSKLKAMNLKEEPENQDSAKPSKTYLKHISQHEDHKQARTDIAEKERLEIEESNIQKLKDSKEYRDKLDHTARKEETKKRKQQKKT